MQQVKTLDFTGKTIFCGIDVHKTSWSVCLSMGGMILKRFSQGPNPKDLNYSLNRLYPGANYRAVYEAGFCSFYPQRIMTSLGIDSFLIILVQQCQNSQKNRLYISLKYQKIKLISQNHWDRQIS